MTIFEEYGAFKYKIYIEVFFLISLQILISSKHNVRLFVMSSASTTSKTLTQI